MGLFKNFNKFNNSIAIIDYYNNSKISYNDIVKQSRILKKKLNNKNLILILAENSIGPILSYIYSIINNYVVIFIDSNINKSEIIKIVKKFRPSYIACNDKNVANIFGYNKLKLYFNINKNFNLYKSKFKNYKLNKNLQILLPTSGSLGSNKYVKVSRKNIYENTISIIKYLRISNKDTAITNMPFNYSYMLSILNTHLQQGGTIVVSNLSIIQKDFWQIFKKFKVTSFNGVPYIYEIMEKIGLKRIFYKHLRYITHAGGKLDKNLSLKIAQLSLKKKTKFFSMYGQTEASPRISFLDPKYSLKKNGSIGKAIPNTKMWIERKKTVISKPYVNGDIMFSGKNIMMGYAKNYLDLIKNTKTLKKLKTGDIGFFDKDGFFFITGRSKRFAKIYGNRVDLDEIESKMKLLKLDIVCIGKFNKINIFYNNKKLIKKIKKNLFFLIKQNLDHFNFIYLKKFPRTSSRKINYNVLNKLND